MRREMVDHNQRTPAGALRATVRTARVERGFIRRVEDVATS